MGTQVAAPRSAEKGHIREGQSVFSAHQEQPLEKQAQVIDRRASGKRGRRAAETSGGYSLVGVMGGGHKWWLPLVERNTSGTS